MKDEHHVGILTAGNLMLASASPAIASINEWMHFLVNAGQFAAAVVTVVFTIQKLRQKKRKPK